MQGMLDVPMMRQTATLVPCAYALTNAKGASTCLYAIAVCRKHFARLGFVSVSLAPLMVWWVRLENDEPVTCAGNVRRQPFERIDYSPDTLAYYGVQS